MPKRPHKLHRVSATDLQRLSGAVLKKVGNDGEHIIIERAGYSIAVMIPFSEYNALFTPEEKPDPTK